MFKRAITSTTLVLTLFAGALTYSYAGAFIITAPKTVKQGERVSIEVKTDQSTATAVKLSITTRAGTEDYNVELVNGIGARELTFTNPGSVILEVANSADAKDFTTKSLHVTFALGGKK